MSDIFSLRFEVYCKERRFLRPENYPDGEERDAYDRYAVHFAAYNRDSRVVGGARLVLPRGPKPFPFEEHCNTFSDCRLPPRNSSAEISRLVVHQDYRHKVENTVIGFSMDLAEQMGGIPLDISYTHIERRSPSSRILMGLYKKIYLYSKQEGLTHWYAAMERPLFRLLKQTNFPFIQIGPESDYYGAVAMYAMSVRGFEQALLEYQPNLYRWFTNQTG